MPPNATGDAIPDEKTPLINNDVESGANTSSRDDDNPIAELSEEDKPRKFLCVTATPSTLKQSFGIGLVVVAGILFTVSNVIQKKFISVDQWHLLFFRAVIQMATMSGFVLYVRVSPFGSTWKDTGRIMLQGMGGGLLLLFIYMSIQRVPLGNSSAIFFCTPVFTFVFAVCMLGERMGLYRVFISILMLAGVCLISRPPFIFGPDATPSGGHDDLDNSFNVLGYALAFMVPVMSAVVSIVTRQLKHIHPSVLMLWFGLGGLVVALGGMTFVSSFHFGDVVSSSERIMCVLSICALGILGNVLYTVAMKYVSPSKANVFRSFEVILNFVLQITIEHGSFHLIALLGIACLLLAVVATGFENEAMRKWRVRFKFL